MYGNNLTEPNQAAHVGEYRRIDEHYFKIQVVWVDGTDTDASCKTFVPLLFGSVETQDCSSTYCLQYHEVKVILNHNFFCNLLQILATIYGLITFTSYR